MASFQNQLIQQHISVITVRMVHKNLNTYIPVTSKYQSLIWQHHHTLLYDEPSKDGITLQLNQLQHISKGVIIILFAPTFNAIESTRLLSKYPTDSSQAFE